MPNIAFPLGLFSLLGKDPFQVVPFSQQVGASLKYFEKYFTVPKRAVLQFKL